MNEESSVEKLAVKATYRLSRGLKSSVYFKHSSFITPSISFYRKRRMRQERCPISLSHYFVFVVCYSALFLKSKQNGL